MPLLDNPLVVTLLLSLWGLAVKYLPFLKDVPNRLIPIMTLALAIVAKLAAPEPATPSGLSVMTCFPASRAAFTSSSWR